MLSETPGTLVSEAERTAKLRQVAGQRAWHEPVAINLVFYVKVHRGQRHPSAGLSGLAKPKTP